MNAKQRRLVDLVASESFGVDHEDDRLNDFCDDKGDETDTFNECHEAGWLRTMHNSDTSWSQVYATDDGRAALSDLPPSKGEKP